MTFDGNAGAHSNDDCTNLGVLQPGSPPGGGGVNVGGSSGGGASLGLNSLNFINNYSGTLTVVAPLSVGALNLTGGASSAIDQPYEFGGNDITVTSGFNWTNGR